ncbi:MAG: heavy metal response regulator transcription factor [Gammaproteobacteria bacterium]
MRILIVEDEPKSAAYLKKGLTENGFIADTASDGQEGLYLGSTQSYDLIILDIMLPKLDGLSVISQLRKRQVQTPVLFLSAKGTTEDRVKGLELGADDYLVKPFAFTELLARIRSILRRGQINSPEKLTVADLTIDLLAHKAMRGEKKLLLTPKEFTLLSLLVRRKGEVLSRTVIAEQVWGMLFDSDTNVVDVAMKRLRQKVDDPFDKKLIHTIRGAGYVLEDNEHS